MMDAYSSPLDIRLQAEDLVEMIHESISAARDQIEKEGVDYEPVECAVEAVDPVIIQVSRFHIVMVLTNLVKNGIQAHAVSDRRLGEGRVVIGIERGEDGVKIKISDKGRGVAPGDLQKLVQFIPGGTSKRGGSGYGLPICRRYVQAHDGRMQIESEENAGTTVTINLPCNGQQADS
jgi:signal transduction histidine kinase